MREGVEGRDSYPIDELESLFPLDNSIKSNQSNKIQVIEEKYRENK